MVLVLARFLLEPDGDRVIMVPEPFLFLGVWKAEVFAATVPQRERRSVVDMSWPVSRWGGPFWWG